MSEEAKKGGQCCCKVKGVFSVLLKVILGLLFLVSGVILILGWWEFLLVIIKGSLGLLLILAGLITLAIAKE